MRTLYVICGWTFILSALIHAGELAVKGSIVPAYIIAIIAFISAGFLVSFESKQEVDDKK